VPQKKYQVEDLQKKMKKSRSKIAQFLTETLKEQELEQQQSNRKLFTDSYKYIFECQQEGHITSLLLVYTAKNELQLQKQLKNLETAYSWLHG
jgi:mRNA-degrading endonuclease YafQ of YafQ-DinJ toxin-antitoxin module